MRFLSIIISLSIIFAHNNLIRQIHLWVHLSSYTCTLQLRVHFFLWTSPWENVSSRHMPAIRIQISQRNAIAYLVTTMFVAIFYSPLQFCKGGSEGPDQNARIHGLIWAFAVCISHENTFFRGPEHWFSSYWFGVISLIGCQQTSQRHSSPGPQPVKMYIITCAPNENRSDCASAQSDLSLRWALCG